MIRFALLLIKLAYCENLGIDSCERAEEIIHSHRLEPEGIIEKQTIKECICDLDRLLEVGNWSIELRLFTERISSKFDGAEWQRYRSDVESTTRGGMLVGWWEEDIFEIVLNSSNENILIGELARIIRSETYSLEQVMASLSADAETVAQEITQELDNLRELRFSMRRELEKIQPRSFQQYKRRRTTY